VAVDVLVRVEKERAFAVAALEAELVRAVQLDARDRALATELVYGTLRVLPWLEARIAEHAKRGTKRLDARVRAAMAIAAYQLWFSRVPAFAAVSECVEAVRRARGERVAAFANAVLRRVAERVAAEGDARDRTPEVAARRDRLREQAVLASVPAWLREGLERALGEKGARAFVASGVEVPPLVLRVEDASARDAWIERLRTFAGKARFEAGRVSSHAIVARGAGRPQALAGYEEGAWSVQEEGAQLVALALGAGPGERVLDACAGRGNKTAILARAVGEAGAVDAADLHAAKLARLEEELARVGVRARATFAVDWSVGSGEVTDTYDAVLVDAPCSGTGTLRRRPELALRSEPGNLAELARVQQAILARAAEHVRAGGRLVYAVCSVLREESEEVVDAVVRERGDLTPAPFTGEAARAIAGDGATLRLLPHVHGTDGYFVASLVRTR
jgi:16S rRNA (cytosine967-C5)-methyltransferase